MFHDAKNDNVALAQVGTPPRHRDQIDGLGSVAHKDNFAGLVGIDETSYFAPGVLIGCGRLFCQSVHAAMDIRIVLMIVLRHGRDDRLGLLRCGRIVQVD